MAPKGLGSSALIICKHEIGYGFSFMHNSLRIKPEKGK